MSEPVLVLRIGVDPTDPQRIFVEKQGAGLLLCNAATLTGILAMLQHEAMANAAFPGELWTRIPGPMHADYAGTVLMNGAVVPPAQAEGT